MTSNKDLHFFTGLLWILIAGYFVATFWLGPKLPVDIIAYSQSLPLHFYAVSANAIFYVLLLVFSVGVWFQNKNYFWILLLVIGVKIIATLISGPVAVYQWSSFFENFFVVLLGVLLCSSFLRFKEQDTKHFFTLFRVSIVITLLFFGLSFLAASLTDSSLPPAFVNFTSHLTHNDSTFYSILFLIVVALFIVLPIFLFFRVKIYKMLCIAVVVGSIIVADLDPDAFTAWDAAAGIVFIVSTGIMLRLLYSAEISKLLIPIKELRFVKAFYSVAFYQEVATNWGWWTTIKYIVPLCFIVGMIKTVLEVVAVHSHTPPTYLWSITGVIIISSLFLAIAIAALVSSLIISLWRLLPIAKYRCNLFACFQDVYRVGIVTCTPILVVSFLIPDKLITLALICCSRIYFRYVIRKVRFVNSSSFGKTVELQT